LEAPKATNDASLRLLDQAIGCRVPIPQSTAIDLAWSVLREAFKKDDLLGYLVGSQALCHQIESGLVWNMI
jgi:hypothetical protein